MSIEIKFHEQKEGWKHKVIHNGQFIAIERPREIGGGFVTVDVKRRIFSIGYGRVPRHMGNKTDYTGMGWLDRLVRDAIDHLEKTMKELP